MSKEDIQDLFKYDSENATPEGIPGGVSAELATALEIYTATKDISLNKDLLSDKAVERQFGAFKFRNQYFLRTKLKQLEALKITSKFEKDGEAKNQLSNLITETKMQLDYLNSHNLKADFEQEITAPALIAKEIKELIAQIQDPETTADKAELQDSLEEKLLLFDELKNVYGLETISYGQAVEATGLSPALKQSTSAFSAYEPRLIANAPGNIKDAIFYNAGKALMNDNQLGQLETEDEQVDFITKNYEYQSKKSREKADQLLQTYEAKASVASNIYSELETAGAEMGEAKNDAADFGVSPEQLIDTPSTKRLLDQGQISFDKTAEENQAVADEWRKVIGTQLEGYNQRVEALKNTIERWENNEGSVKAYNKAKSDPDKLNSYFILENFKRNFYDPT